MTSVVWSARARADLRSLVEFVATTSDRYAAHVALKLVVSVRRLQQFPESGRIVPELRDSMIREVIWKSYRIVYSYAPESSLVTVLTVFRSERMFPDLRPHSGSV